MIDAPPACVLVVTASEDAVLEQVRQKLRTSESWAKLDALDDYLATQPGFTPPLNHIFTPTKFAGVSLYTREGFIPKGHFVTTRIHLTDHPFVISLGRVAIWCDGNWEFTQAPFTGVTKAGTRRLLVALEDTIFSSFHVTDKTDPDDIVREISFSEGRFAELGIAAAVSKPSPVEVTLP